MAAAVCAIKQRLYIQVEDPPPPRKGQLPEYRGNILLLAKTFLICELELVETS
jgi:hypothetical protein